jgi:hypothetical protein
MTDHRSDAPSRAQNVRLLRLALAILASQAVGAVVGTVVIYVVLPAVGAGIRPQDRGWLRAEFLVHPYIVVGLIFILSLLLASPAIWVFVKVRGPLPPRGER